MPKTKVCMLASGHSALDGRIFYKESCSLERGGYEVNLIAPLNSQGVLFDMDRKPLASSEMTLHGVHISGFSIKPLIPKLSAILDLASAQTGIRIGADRYQDLISKGLQVQADVYHCHELSSLYAGVQLKRRLEEAGRHPKLVYDMHEYSEAPLGTTGTGRFYQRARTKANYRFLKEALEYVDYAFFANQITRGHLLTLNRFLRTKVLYNCPYMAIFQEPTRQRHADKIIICHEGSLTFDRGLKQMLDVMQILNQAYPGRIGLLIVGDVFGEERAYFEARIRESGLNDIVKRTGWLPYTQVGEAVTQADIGIILMEYTENNMLAGPPNKLFNYMRYGLPVVSVDLPETSRIISETGCGIVVRDRTTENLVKALVSLIEDKAKFCEMSSNARKAVNSYYRWIYMEKMLLEAYEELLS